MKTNELGKALIKKWEGLRLHAYEDTVGIPTIGYGHTGSEVKLGTYITEQQAETYLAHDLTKFEQAITRMVTVPLNSNQFSALVSLAFNVGPGSLKDKGLMIKLNSGDYQGCANSFPKYDNAGGKEDMGLYRRRLDEKALFLTPVDSDPSQDPLDKAAQTLQGMAA